MVLLKNFFLNLLLFQYPLRWFCWFNRRREGVGVAGQSRMVWLALCLLGLFLPAAAQALVQGEILGVARVIDGDTIDIQGQRIRLHGIDAPESSQECLSSRRVAWRCGQHASQMLAEHVDRAVGVKTQRGYALSSQRSSGPITLARCMIFAASLVAKPQSRAKPAIAFGR